MKNTAITKTSIEKNGIQVSGKKSRVFGEMERAAEKALRILEQDRQRRNQQASNFTQIPTN